MKTLIIYSHPNDKSYNASILETVKENLSSKHELKILDLYKEKSILFYVLIQHIGEET